MSNNTEKDAVNKLYNILEQTMKPLGDAINDVTEPLDNLDKKYNTEQTNQVVSGIGELKGMIDMLPNAFSNLKKTTEKQR